MVLLHHVLPFSRGIIVLVSILPHDARELMYQLQDVVVGACQRGSGGHDCNRSGLLDYFRRASGAVYAW